MMIRYGRWVALAFLVFFIATRPDSAANVGKTIMSTIGTVASGFATFLSGLAT